MTSVLPPPAEPPPSEPSMPPRATPDFSRGEDLAARAPELAVILLAAFATNIAFRASLASVAAMLASLLLVVALVAGRRIEQRDSLGLIALVIVLSPWLFGRSAPALTGLTVVSILALLALAAALTRTGRLFDLRASEIISHQASMVAEWAFALPMVNRALTARATDRPVAASLRGLAFAAPVVLVFALLLASADTVFARVLVFDNHLGPVASHVVGSAFLALLGLGLISRAAHRTPGVAFAKPPPLGVVEVTIVLGAVIVLFGAFVGTKVITALGGANHIIETANLTQAEYARQGFFQLLWVAALALLLIGALRSVHDVDPAMPQWRFRRLSICLLALTLMITAISIQRLLLYTQALGLTQKRLWSMAAAVAIGLLVIGYAASLAGVRNRQSWFPGAVVVFGAVFVVAMNLMNPDAFITRYNLTHPPAEREVDIRAISRLSDDAIPVAIEYRHQLPDAQRSDFEALLCRRLDLVPEFGALGSNRARSRADTALDELCPEPRPLPWTRRSD